FMYNNWPLKNPNPDVTVGIGRSVRNEDEAASDEIRTAFRVKGPDGQPTDQIPSADDMRAEFRRVVALQRTPDNLFSDYGNRSPIIMDRDAMLNLLQNNMLGFWDSKGQDFPNFDQIPAQAQIALMSYNYGLRLSNAPKMCNAVRANDYTTAANES